MSFKSKSIATKLLFASCLTAVLVIVAIVAFIKLSIIPQMTNRALENQTSALAHSLKGIHASPEHWTEDYLSRAKLLDAFTNDGKTVVTMFLFKHGDYVRARTTLKKADGAQAVGSVLDPNSDAAKALKAGKEYSGQITLFDRRHMSTYLPVSFQDGTRGAVFVGIDYGSADPMLALASQMDYLVIGVGIVGIALLGVGLFFSVRVEASHREIEDIFRTTQDGLFLLNHELRMGAQTSKALTRVLGFEVKPGDYFLDLLKPSVSPKTFDTAKEYIELLLRHDVKEKLVASLNPLDCVEISSLRPNGIVESRFLQIRFNRVFKNGKVTHLLVTANNISRQVRLERELRESERRVQDQMTMMVYILQADPRLLQEFLASATHGLNEINEMLRTSNPTTGIETRCIDAIARTAHQLKGDAAALQLDAITQSFHGFESVLRELREKTKRTSEDLLPVTVRVKALFSEIAAIRDVIAKIGQIRGIVSVEPARPPRESGEDAVQPMVRQWNAFANQLATRHHKKVDLTYQGLELSTLASSLRETLNTTVNQFVRNAIVHGVETPSERKLRGKSEAAHLAVYVSDQGDGFVELSFRDDGAGINLEKVRQAAVRSGRFTAEAAQSLDTRRLTMMIFEPWLSTQEEANEDAGRGVGLDAVKEMISRQGGRIRIGSTRGEYCHLRVQLPLKLDAEASAAGKAAKHESKHELGNALIGEAA
ncbi:Cache 3/Cache 2 fusion domain-containing protein [Propionivibrio limicola]|uniref:Cache 3/Cache 2 fusion domain-containing protein n=1 Tax=Propionivibrio limicola TaxID=167645 RepID=UPI00129097B6|nr:Cache 3/Cache 2 fusion domain-containing protein [Propionivibrio limicola]